MSARLGRTGLSPLSSLIGVQVRSTTVESVLPSTAQQHKQVPYPFASLSKKTDPVKNRCLRARVMLEPVKRKNKCSILHLREQELSNGLKATVAYRVDFNEQRMHRLNPHLSSSAQQLQWEKLPDGFLPQSPQGDVSSAHSGFRRSSDMQLQYP